MKKIIGSVLLIVILTLQLSGCGTGEEEMPDVLDTEELQTPDGLNSQGGAEASNQGKDNSLDTYSLVVHTPLRVEQPEKVISGGGEKVFLGISRAYYFKKHLFENVDECWDELSFVTAEGEAASEKFEWENQLWGVGPVAGTDHYVAFGCEMQEGGEGYRYFLTERDENQGIVREFPLDFLEGSSSSGVAVFMDFADFAVDSSEVVHLVRQTEDGQQYILVSSAGEILAEYLSAGNDIGRLIPLYDGRVAFEERKWDDRSQRMRTDMQYMDAEAGRPVLLASPEKEIYCFTLYDEKTLLYADDEGVYRSGLSGDNPELLYRWSNHGITREAARGVTAMQTDEKGQIAILYMESETYNYLCLEPTTEEVEICEITMAVSSIRMSTYHPLVVAFNKQHPDCHIELKSDYDETALLAELTAGKGPVLVDTFLTGFEEQEKLWEPLDTVMEQQGITEEMIPSVLEMGKIDGSLYGIVTDFSLRTLVTGEPDLKDWDYNMFLQRIEDRPELEAIFNFYGGDYGAYFIMGFLSHGIDDTYLLDAEAGTMNFNSSGFREALELAKKYCVRPEGVDPGNSLLEGKVLCNELSIRKPEQLALYRICYGENANYIGYPTKDGAAHFMESGGSPVAIRRTATEKEKAVAASFISLCLSYEGQILAAKDLNFGLSVRKDVLEEQIAAMNERTEADASGFGQIILGDDLNVQLDRKTLLDMIEKARPMKYFPIELRNIMFEELEQYFSGELTENMVIDHLESRVGLWLGERK